MDLDGPTVTSLLALGGAAVAIYRQRSQARQDAYDNARADLGDCRETAKRQETRIDALEADAVTTKGALATCQEGHAECIGNVRGLRTEVAELRAVVHSVRST